MTFNQESSSSSTDQQDGFANILCCLCGIQIKPNAANMCINCLQGEVDITEGISKQITIFCCRGCGRYLKNPQWVRCDLESTELLALCLKKINGLQKVKLIDAQFIWTEPHSKRIKVKLTVQSEVMNGVKLQQSFPVEYVLENQQCDVCQKSYTENIWKACVQVRQKVTHKRTFFYLEQVILKYSMTDNVTGLKEVPHGLDFYFEARQQAVRLVDFLSSVAPVRHNSAKRLVSADDKSNVSNFKYTILIDIAPICKDDLVCVSKKVLRKLGGGSPLLLCIRITANIHLLDPLSLRHVEVRAQTFFSDPFRSICNSKQLVEFVILDIEPLEREKSKTRSKGKWKLARVECARSSDMGVNDITFECTTHLGNILHAGDTCLGYDLNITNFNPSDTKAMHGKPMPEIVLIRKVYNRRSGKRKWRLKQLTIERENRYSKKMNKAEMQREDHEREQFLQDLEEDPEMRQQVVLWRVKNSNSDDVSMTSTDAKNSDDDAPTVGLNELLEDLDLSDHYTTHLVDAPLSHEAQQELQYSNVSSTTTDDQMQTDG
uniref:60S ribosomal export protein NMD3 n=1 Tax=Hirondellea gigas TaxID=1518452 RepID=A0A2P2I6L6_9CRUS